MADAMIDKTTNWDRLQTNILLVLKVGKEEHLNLLADGKLRCRRLAYYKNIEEAGQAHHDGDEGIVAIYQAGRTKIVLGTTDREKHVIDSGTGLTGHVPISRDYDNPVFCMHAIHTGEWTQFTEAELPEFKRFLEIPKKMDEFGTHVWLIREGKEFRERLRKACIELGIRCVGRLVRYVSAVEMHGNVPDEFAGFVKLDSFAPEREYRFVFSANEPLSDPFVLDVGSLRDITEVVPLEDFRRNWSIRMRA